MVYGGTLHTVVLLLETAIVHRFAHITFQPISMPETGWKKLSALARPASARPGLVQPEATRLGIAQHGPARPEAVRPGPRRFTEHVVTVTLSGTLFCQSFPIKVLFNKKKQ